MKKVAKVLAVIFVCLSILILPGCNKKQSLPQTSISLSLAFTSDGMFRQDLEFSMQSDKLKSVGVKENLIQEVQNNMINAVNNLRNEFYLSYLVTYSLAPNQDYKMGEALVVSDCVYNEKYDIVYFSIIFKDIYTWRYYHGQEVTNDSVSDAASSVKFFEKTTSSGQFPFAAEYILANGEKTTIGERYLKIYNNAFNVTLPNEICSQLDSPAFVYDYATPYASLRSNAENVIKSGGLYHNIWVKNLQNFQTAEITLQMTKIYYKWWYLSVMILAIVILLIGLIVLKIKKGKLFTKNMFKL